MKWIHDLRGATALALIASLISASAAYAGFVEGFTEPYRDIEVSVPGEPGLIIEIRVKEGERVSQNDILAVLDTKVLEASLQVAKRRAALTGRIQAAIAEVTLRQNKAEKLRALNSRGHASPIELERAETDLEVAKANVVLAEEERDLAALECLRIEAQIERQRLRSPIDGIVVDVFKEAGESTQIGDSRMLQLVQLSSLRVKFPVSVPQASQVTAGDTIEVTLPEISQQTSAVVEVVSPVLDAKSGTVNISCVIENSRGEFRSGMRCLMEVEGGDEEVQDEELDDFDAEDILNS